MRLAVGILLGSFYLRPQALLGAAAVAYSMYRSAMLQQERYSSNVTLQQQQEANARQQQQRPSRSAAAVKDNTSFLTTVVTWLLVAYTRCLPILLLGLVASLLSVLVHCALHRACSEYRHRQMRGFTWRQVLGQGAWMQGGAL